MKLPLSTDKVVSQKSQTHGFTALHIDRFEMMCALPDLLMGLT